MKEFFILSLFVFSIFESSAEACQYGIGFSRQAKALVEERYGDRVQVTHAEAIDRSFNFPRLTERRRGNSCPDVIRVVGKVHAILDGTKECVFTTHWIPLNFDDKQYISRRQCKRIQTEEDEV